MYPSRCLITGCFITRCFIRSCFIRSSLVLTLLSAGLSAQDYTRSSELEIPPYFFINTTSIPIMPSLDAVRDRPCVSISGGMGGWPDQYPGGGYSHTPPIVILMDGIGSAKKDDKDGKGSPAQEGTGDEEGHASDDSWMDGLGDSFSSDSGGSASGAGQNPSWGGGELLGAEGFQSILAQVEALMESLPDGDEVILIADLDDTLLPVLSGIAGHQEGQRRQFTDFVNKWRAKGKLRFIVVTQNGIAVEAGYFESHQLPEPDYLLSGTHPARPLIVHAAFDDAFLNTVMPYQPRSDQLICEAMTFRTTGNYYFEFLGESMPNYLARMLNLQQIPVTLVNLSPSIGEEIFFNVTVDDSFDINNEANFEMFQEALFNAFGCLATAVSQEGNRMYVSFPLNKGALIRRLAKAMKLKGRHIVVLGDSNYDFSMMTSNDSWPEYSVTIGVVVANASEDDKKAAQKQNGIVIARRPFIAGVVEGLFRLLKKILPDSPLAM